MRKVPRIDSFEDWPYETCYWCGQRINNGFEVSDEDWNAVTGEPDITLCPSCFDKEAQKKKVDYRVLNYCFVTWSNQLRENEVSDA